MSTSDVEDQLLSYVARRQNGTSTLARAVVARTVARYTAAVWVLENGGATSSRFWDAMEVRTVPFRRLSTMESSVTLPSPFG